MKHLVIDTRIIKNNLQSVKSKAGKSAIYADLSGDAFGMGLLETARLLRDEGIRNFVVSDPKDAKILRQNGFYDEKIMMLRSTADSGEIREMMDLGVICTVGSYDAAVAVNGIAEERRTVCEVQIKIDTGMGRYGFSTEEIDKISSIYKYMQSLAVVGVFSTFSQSWKSRKRTSLELEKFMEVLEKLHKMGFETGVSHICDSAALYRYSFGKLDAVRIGEAFSGRVPGKSIQGLHKVGYIEAGIEEVGWFPKGHRPGGGKPLGQAAKLAVLAVGYYHGYGVVRPEEDKGIFDFFRNRRRKLYVRIGKKKAKVVGTVGMMHTIIDVTKIDCAVGDAVMMDVDPVNVKGMPRVYKTMTR